MILAILLMPFIIKPYTGHVHCAQKSILDLKKHNNENILDLNNLSKVHAPFTSDI